MKLRFNRFQRFTALALMQRVYITKTLWEIPPPLAMISSLFLVCKFVKPVELDALLNSIGYGEDFREKFNPDEQMQKVELAVLTAIDFKLRVHLPFHQAALIAKQIGIEDEWSQVCFDILKTDALLLHPPGAIAVAALARTCGKEATMKALHELGVEIPGDMDSTIDDILSLTFDVATEEEVKAIENQVGPEMAVFHIIDKERQKEEANVTAPTSMLPP